MTIIAVCALLVAIATAILGFLKVASYFILLAVIIYVVAKKGRHRK